MTNKTLCPWCGTDPLYIKYHDEEWGVPVHDDQKLFEFLILEGAQAGLSWITILRRREGYRKALWDFDYEAIAKIWEENLYWNREAAAEKAQTKEEVSTAAAHPKPSNFSPKFQKVFDELLSNEEIIRNRLKIVSVFNNAHRFIAIRKEFGTFDNYIWSFLGENRKPIVNKWSKLSELPARTELSDKISKDLKKRGFKFIGSTIIYAYMQAVGIVDDHLDSCWRRTN